MSTFDHGELNIPGRLKNLDREIDRHLREQRKVNRQRAKEHTAAVRAARQAERDRPKFTAADLAGATHVRDQFGWHRVVRVNAKSVTVATPYSWTDRIDLARVLDAYPRAETTRTEEKESSDE